MLNVNVGLLGHVDSGKTALAKALSRTASTAAFDKSPQSQSRGITLDLGFSAREVTMDVPGCGPALEAAGVQAAQLTLVDCPGHASLIRTIVGGAQIIDAMVLVIDATKGIQAQTAECLVLGEVLAKPLVVVINKVDAIQGSDEAAKTSALAVLRRRLQHTFQKTRWPKVPMIEVAAEPRRDGVVSAPQNTEAVLPAILSVLDLAAMTQKSLAESACVSSFYMLVDHCFAVRGQGTVFTGTIASGVVHVGDVVLLPELQTTRKVKNLQVFHRPVEVARGGDRVGLCVAQFDPTSMERGVLCSAELSPATASGAGGLRGAPKVSKASGPTATAAPLTSSTQFIAEVHRVRYHPLPCSSQTKLHVTIAHSTVVGTMRFFSRRTSTEGVTAPLDLNIESLYLDELGDEAVQVYSNSATEPLRAGAPSPAVENPTKFYALLLLERPVFAAVGSTVIAMRLDVERDNFCRIALAGTIRCVLNDSVELNQVPLWRQLPIVRFRQRTLRVDRILDERSCIADGVVSLDLHSSSSSEGRQKSSLLAEVQKFVGLRVAFHRKRAGKSSGDATDGHESDAEVHDDDAVCGRVDSTFGKTGKVKLVFEAPVFEPIDASTIDAKKGEAGSVGGRARDSLCCTGSITLSLKKYPLALHSSIEQ